MFLIFFLVFTFIFTVFENVALAGIFLVLVCILLGICQLISSKKILSRQILLSLFAAFLVAGIAFGVKEWRYYGTIERWNDGTIERWNDGTIERPRRTEGRWNDGAMGRWNEVPAAILDPRSSAGQAAGMTR